MTLSFIDERELASEFEMDLELMQYFLGLEVWQKPGEIFLSQGKYIVKLLERCGMVDCKSVNTLMELNFKKLCGSVVGPELANPIEYRQLVGALMFLVNSRPDICFSVNTLSQYMVEPHHIHWIVAKHIDIRYHFIRDTVQWGAIRLQNIKTDEQVADILTKPLEKVKFFIFREKLGVVERPSYESPI
eukprot:PITA_28057